ncbi:hypothetical protein B7463_g6069, partial [Scytalidium lignicola]
MHLASSRTFQPTTAKRGFLLYISRSDPLSRFIDPYLSASFLCPTELVENLDYPGHSWTAAQYRVPGSSPRVDSSPVGNPANSLTYSGFGSYSGLCREKHLKFEFDATGEETLARRSRATAVGDGDAVFELRRISHTSSTPPHVGVVESPSNYVDTIPTNANSLSLVSYDGDTTEPHQTAAARFSPRVRNDFNRAAWPLDSSSPDDLHDYVSLSGDDLFQHPPAIFGLPLTATISTDYGAHANLESYEAPDFVSRGDVANEHTDAPVALAHNHAATKVALEPGYQHGRQRGSRQDYSGHITTSSVHSSSPSTFSSPRQYVFQRSEPLQTREAHLVKFFMQTWGPLLDCNDPERHFALTVSQLALTKAPCLLSAILTISALQLSRVSNYPISAAKQYRRQCGRCLIPVLQDLTNHEMEGAIFTIKVVLSNFVDIVASCERPPDSLFSSSLALSTSPWYAYVDEEGSLKRAAFWVHVREDIHVALFLRCPIKIDYMLFQQNIEAVAQLTNADLIERQGGSSSASTKTSRPTIECAWSNQMIGLTCDVINFCFGPEQDKTVDAWATLLAKAERWNLEKPATFAPFHEQDAKPEENQVFLRISLSCDWHVMGLLYYHLSLILLKSNSPGQQRVFVTTFHGKGEIINHTRILCGIVISNPIAQALIVACHMINVAGVFLESPGEQNEVLQLLQMTRTATGWPVAEVSGEEAQGGLG